MKGAKATLGPAELLNAYSGKLENMWGQVLKAFQEAAEAEAKACLEWKLSELAPTFKALSAYASLADLVCKDVHRGTVPERALQENQLVAGSMPKAEALLGIFINNEAGGAWTAGPGGVLRADRSLVGSDPEDQGRVL